MSTKKQIFPIQPIVDGRFVKNGIVKKLLEVAPINMNDIACMDFTDQERIQFAQLIGYSLDGFSTLSYVDDETYGAAIEKQNGEGDEHQARNNALREQLEIAREGVKMAACGLFKIHPDDLEV